MDIDFKVKIGGFEGPLELILDLIEKRKLHISDVSLSQVADEFIEHTKSHEDFPISDSADFILIASTLLLIKSKSLLPNLPLTVEEQENIYDLENRLSTYKKYKTLAKNLEKMFGNFLYFAKEKKRKNVVFSPTPEVSQMSLQDALQEVIKNMPKKIEALPKVVVEKIISLEETIDKLRERIQTSLKTSFKDFARLSSPAGSDNGGQAGMGSSTSSPQAKQNKVNVIVIFLAMLELVKQGAVRVKQDRHFEDIQIEGENTGVPIY